MMVEQNRSRLHFIAALGLATVVSLALYGYGVLSSGSLTYLFLPWNLFLAWLPMVFALALAQVLQRKLWSSWSAIVLSLLWLGFLPNSFYMVSDFIHLQDVPTVDVLYDAIMFTSFIYVGVMLGMSSLYLVHLELKKRFTPPATTALVTAILLLCSFAIYIGRDLRWNTWDILINPAGLLFDISERLLYPREYPDMFLTVIAFFVLFGSMYVVALKSIQLLKSSDD
jgi:uncharacterized membrane protein